MLFARGIDGQKLWDIRSFMAMITCTLSILGFWLTLQRYNNNDDDDDDRRRFTEKCHHIWAHMYVRTIYRRQTAPAIRLTKFNCFEIGRATEYSRWVSYYHWTIARSNDSREALSTRKICGMSHLITSELSSWKEFAGKCDIFLACRYNAARNNTTKSNECIYSQFFFHINKL